MVVPTMAERARRSCGRPNFLKKNDERDEITGEEVNAEPQEEKNYFVAVQYSQESELH